MERVAIIGGGLTGLATAYYLGKAQPSWTIDVWEETNRFGGKIRTKRVDGYVVEVGPDSYLARKKELTDLIHEVGLGDTLVRNATGQSFIYDRTRLYPIPGGSIVGIPTEFIPFAKSSLLSWKGKFRAMSDWLKSPYPTDGDVSIGDFFRYHLGQEMMDKLIEPLLAGIYGGDIYRLSLDATFPEFHRLERQAGNMVKGMMESKRKQRQLQKEARKEGKTPQAVCPRGYSSKKPQGMFCQVTGGLESIVEAVIDHMPPNVTLHKESPVTDMHRQGASYALCIGDGQEVLVDRVIITTPPHPYRQWFRDDDAFNVIRDMEQSTCAIAIMSFDKKAFNVPLNGTGFVITRTTDTPLTACTYLTAKWPQTTPQDKVVLRVFLGKPGDPTVAKSTGKELENIAIQEIQRILGVTATPEWVEMIQLRDSMPQYHVGHRTRCDGLLAHVAANYPGLHVIGTPFFGVGIPDGVKQAQELVKTLTSEV